MGRPVTCQDSTDQQQQQPLLSQQPYYGIPIQPQPQPSTTTVLLLPLRRHRRRYFPSSCSSSLLALSFSLFLLSLSLFLLFPSDPTLSLSRLRLRSLSLDSSGLSLSLALTVKVQNRDFFSLDYDSILVSVGYRGERLGFVNSKGGRIRARGVSYVDAELKLDGVTIVSDIFYLIEDIARGSVPFDTVTEINGRLRIFFVDFPVDGRFSCAVNVNPDNQSIVRQDCYPE